MLSVADVPMPVFYSVIFIVLCLYGVWCCMALRRYLFYVINRLILRGVLWLENTLSEVRDTEKGYGRGPAIGRKKSRVEPFE